MGIGKVGIEPPAIHTKEEPMARILIACGGTGGHLFPGMAVGRLLLEHGHSVLLWLAGKAIERSAASGWPGPVETLELEWSSSLSACALPRTMFRFLCAWRHARKGLHAFHPDVLLAMGSRSSLIPVLAARAGRVPVVLHEANVVPGRAIRILSRLCKTTVAISFADTARYLPGRALVHTGYPLRPLPVHNPLPGLPAGPNPLILVMGGSQGASRVNALALDAFRLLHAQHHAFRILHLAGEREADSVRSAYTAYGLPALVLGFLRDMGAAYAAADIAISRAGAGSCSELALFGIPTLFIPYPYAGNHQRFNAALFEKKGAGRLFIEKELTPQRLADAIAFYLDNPTAREQARIAARQLAWPDATERVARLLLETALKQ